MRLWKIVATATAVEGAVCAAVFSLAGLGGAWNGWLDLLNNLAPVWFALAILSAPVAAVLAPPGRGRRAIVGLAVFAGLISGIVVLPEFAASVALPHLGRTGPISNPLKIVTFNTWSDNNDPGAVVRRVRDADPDIAALIEMSWDLHHQGLKALAVQYPYQTPGNHRCPPDMVILSKRPFLAFGCQNTVASNRPDVMETIVWARAAAPDGRPFTLATTHYAWPFPHGGQDVQRPALARFIHDHADEDTILTGDFNLTPWTFALRAQDRNLKPLTRRDHAVFTWPAMIARLNKPAPFAILPIDHIYAGKAWRTMRIARLAPAGSDHYGIEAVFSR